MNVLLACEYSNIGSQAFRDRGHTVYSVDLEPNEQPELSNGYHYQGDIFEFWKDRPCEFDLMIGHPPCTFMSNAAARWLWNEDGSKNQERWQGLFKAVQFFNRLWALPVKRKCFENPVMVGHARELLDAGKQTQTIQPYDHGIMETKRLCLWLDNLDPLKSTKDVKAETMALPYSERAKVHYASPGPDRWKERSRSYPEIMAAMAAQWS